MDTDYIDLRNAKPDWDAKAQAAAKPIQAQVVLPPAPTIICRTCGGMMHAHSQTTGQAMGIGLGLLLIGLGIIGGLIALGLCFSIIGIIFGVPLGLVSIAMIVAGLFCGGKTEHFWRCGRCFSVIPRA